MASRIPTGSKAEARRLEDAPLPVRPPHGKGHPCATWKGFGVNKTELAKVERYLRQKFANHSLRVVGRPKKDDSAEVYVGDEFIGVLFLDDEDGDRSYNFNMAILDTDLED
jgi:Protein of unknown function (DUF3126)